MPARSTSPLPLSLRRELGRKTIHLVALILPLGMVVLPHGWALLVLTIGALLGVAGDVLRSHSTAFARLIERVFGPLMRQEEQPPVGSGIVLNGATWVLLSAVLLLVVFPARVGALALTLFMVADAAAALVGRRYGRTSWRISTRTLEGSAAFVVVGLCLVAVMPTLSFAAGAGVVVVGALTEALPRPFNDNLRVPFAMAATLLVVEHLWFGEALTLFPYLTYVME
jgi:dolichol kinase